MSRRPPHLTAPEARPRWRWLRVLVWSWLALFTDQILHCHPLHHAHGESESHSHDHADPSESAHVHSSLALILSRAHSPDSLDPHTHPPVLLRRIHSRAQAGFQPLDGIQPLTMLASGLPPPWTAPFLPVAMIDPPEIHPPACHPFRPSRRDRAPPFSS
jgi:hypothetical protein